MYKHHLRKPSEHPFVIRLFLLSSPLATADLLFVAIFLSFFRVPCNYTGLTFWDWSASCHWSIMHPNCCTYCSSSILLFWLSSCSPLVSRNVIDMCVHSAQVGESRSPSIPTANLKQACGTCWLFRCSSILRPSGTSLLLWPIHRCHAGLVADLLYPLPVPWGLWATLSH